MCEVDPEASVRALFSAIIIQALDDATQTRRQRIRKQALAWLQSSECHYYLEWLDLVGVDPIELIESSKPAVLRKALYKGHRAHRPHLKGGRPTRRTNNPSRPASLPGYTGPRNKKSGP